MPASDYNANIPQPTFTGATMQPAVLLNFGAIMDLIDVDHVDFAAAGAGKHNKITFPVQGAIPTFAAGDLGLFSLLSPTTAVNELYVYNAAGDSIPTTASILSTDPAPNNNTPGWTYLPSGLLIKWGFGTATGNTTINFPVAANVPVFNQVVNVSVSTMGPGAVDTNTFARVTSFTSTGITAYGSARITSTVAAATFQYLAIGY